jgi:hypothetical protein
MVFGCIVENDIRAWIERNRLGAIERRFRSRICAMVRSPFAGSTEFGHW